MNKKQAEIETMWKEYKKELLVLKIKQKQIQEVKEENILEKICEEEYFESKHKKLLLN